jgi:uncharacterized protein (TIGR03118 family)
LKFSKTLHFIVAAFLSLLTHAATSQTTLGYRQINLACHAHCSSTHNSDSLLNPWGIGFLPGQNFLISENGSGRVDSFDATGLPASGFSIPLPAGSTATQSKPTGIIADPASNFAIRATHFQFFVATEEGTIVGFNIVNGQFQDAQVVVDRSTTAVFTGLTLLHPSCCNPVLAAANFHDGQIEVFSLAPTALSGAFEDPNLPQGYAPYNIQTVGDQVFVTYAKQNQTGRAPMTGEGFGIVSIFDQDGNFVCRFASDGGSLNAPWGITRTSASFGPFPNHILISNAGDGQILIYDPASAEFLGPLTDSEGNVFFNPSVHSLVFRGDHTADGVGDPDTLYSSAVSTGSTTGDGLFNAIQVGRLTTTQLTADQNVVFNTETTLTAEVHPVAGGDEVTGSVTFIDLPFIGPVATVPLSGGVATLHYSYEDVGNHNIFAEYQGNDTLLKSLGQKVVTVLGPPTTTSLTVSQNTVGVGAPITFTAFAQSPGGVPVGGVIFKEGNTILGGAPLDDTGLAAFTTNALPAGAHSVFAMLAATFFQNSTSTPVNISVGGDFQFSPNAPSVNIPMGHSADVTLTVNPSNGFIGPVNFSCVATGGITCSFDPQTLNVNGQTVTAKLTVSSASTPALNSSRAGFALTGFWLFGTMLFGRRSIRRKGAGMLLAWITLIVLGALAACGGNQPPPTGNRNPPQTSTVTLNATSGTITHSTSISVTVQ